MISKLDNQTSAFRIEESDVHSEKQDLPKISIDAGRMISIKPVLRNARSSIRDNLDPISNRIEEESDPHT
jgi:hypothetical protein